MVDLSFYKNALEQIMYRGVCRIEVRKSEKNEETKKTESNVVVVYDEVPCLLSHPADNTATKNVPRAEQGIELFVSPDLLIPPNSKITVTQDGVTDCYGLSGVPNRYPGHQEIHLEKWHKWA